MLEVLTQESVDKLRDLAKHGEDLRESSFESLCETHQLRLTGSDYLIVEKYQHLGTKVVYASTLLPELRHRVAGTHKELTRTTQQNQHEPNSLSTTTKS